MKRGRSIMVIVTVILAVAVLISIVRHFQLRSATNAYRAHLRAEGEPMELEQVIPPPVPARQDSAIALLKAFSLMEADNGMLATNFFGDAVMKEVAPGKVMVGWQQSDDKEEFATNSWPDLTAAVAQNQKVFGLLQQIIHESDANFGIQYDRGEADLASTNFLYLPQSKRAAQRLSAAILCSLHNGDTASAVENLRAMIALVEALRGERLVISELVRSAIAHMAVDANWEVLQSLNLTDDELAQLQGDWAKFDLVQSSEKALEMERVIGEITISKWRASNSELERIMTIDQNVEESLPLTNKESFWYYLKTTPKIVLWRDWWSYPDELRALKCDDVLISAMRMAQTNNSFLEAIQYQSNRLADLVITNTQFDFVSDNSDFRWLFSENIVLDGMIRRVMTTEAAKQLVITAIALKRYELKNGHDPATLDALVPEYLPAAPLDPVDGKPLRYRLNADGTFLLYSVGANGRDDGGNPALEKNFEGSLIWDSNHTLDWVWPQPASQAEIQAFARQIP